MKGFTKKKGKMIPLSLCERCVHAVPSATTGCEWSEDGIPVDGWTVFQFDDPELNRMRNRVMLCPKFSEEGRETLDAPFENFRALGIAIVTMAVVDYRKALEKWERNKDRYEASIRNHEHFDAMAEYKERLMARYQRYGRPDICSLVKNAWANIRAESREWLNTFDEAQGVKQTITSCERFFQSDLISLHTDIAGDYIMDAINRQVKEEKSWQKKAKTTKGYTYRGTNTSSETVNATGS